MPRLAALLHRRARLVLAGAAAGVVLLAIYGLGAFAELRLPRSRTTRARACVPRSSCATPPTTTSRPA